MLTDHLQSSVERRQALIVAIGFVALAILLRLPTWLYSVLNYDESMYILMGDKLRQGWLPYTALCDLKPVGLFAVFAAISALPMDGIFAMRLSAAVTVGLSAFLLWCISPRIFDDPRHRIGTVAGLAYIVFMLTDGGQNAQSELFMNLCSLLGLHLALIASEKPGRPSFGFMALAGLVLGIGLQIKQVVMFDMLAFLAGFFLLTTPRLGLFGQRLRESWAPLLLLAITAVVPTLLIILVYVVTGHWEEWIAGNLTTHRGFYGDSGPPVSWDAGFRAMVEQAPLWIAAVAAVFGLKGWLDDPVERRTIAFLWIWIVLIGICQVFLRFMSDHYFLQFLGPLSLLTGFVLARAVLAHVGGTRPRHALLAVLVVVAVFAVGKNPIVNGFYVARDRLLGDEAYAGDAARQVAENVKADLQPGDALYVVGFMPIVYYLTGAEIPTRFAFTGLPNQQFPGRDGCTWVEPKVELQRILESKPRFIVVEQGIFYRELPPDLRTPLDERLESEYRLRASFEQHWAHWLYPFERFVMNGATSAKVYERVDDATRS